MPESEMLGSGGDLDRVVEYLVRELDRHGRRAADFLATADAHLRGERTEAADRRPESAAYCLREALDAISKAAGDEGPDPRADRRVIEERARFEIARGGSAEDQERALGDLLGAIDELEAALERGRRRRLRLLALLQGRTGVEPAGMSSNPLAEYEALVERANAALHGDASHEEVVGLRDEVVGLLIQLFLPPTIRHRRLQAIAKQPPDEGLLDDLRRLVANPHHWTAFFREVETLDWLQFLWERRRLPAATAPMWPVHIVFHRLAPRDGPELAAWLEEAHGEWGHDLVAASHLASAGAEIGRMGQPVVLKALRRFPDSDHIAFAARRAAEDDASSDFATEVADLLLQPPPPHLEYRSRGVAGLLTTGITADNVLSRLTVVGHKLRRDEKSFAARMLPHDRRALLDFTRDYDDHGGVLLATAAKLVDEAVAVGRGIDEVLDVLNGFEPPARDRLRARALLNAMPHTRETAIEEIAHAIQNRIPNGDDFELVASVVQDGNGWWAPWAAALGEPPPRESLSTALRSEQGIDDGYERAWLWSAALPDEAVAAWTEALDAIAEARGGRVDARIFDGSSSRGEIVSASSPIDVDDLAAMDPMDAARRVGAWRPDPSEFMVTAFQLARTLEDAVKRNSVAWAVAPLEIVRALRHPTYISHYFLGLRASAGHLGDAGERIVDAVRLVEGEPWDVEPLGNDRFDYDETWLAARTAGIDLLAALANTDVDLHTRKEAAWTLALRAARDRGQPSTVLDDERDPLSSAINRPCTRALQATFALAGWEYRDRGVNDPRFFELLEDALGVEDFAGAEHRAIIAPRLGFLLHIAPDWVSIHDDVLFGEAAPGDLGPTTLDLALRWAQPNRWLLEGHVAGVRAAVARGTDNALEQLLIAMLWDVPGYSIDEVVSVLCSAGPQRISDAGHASARLLRPQEALPYLDRGVAFYDAVLAARPGSRALQGFGMWYIVDQLDENTWERLTLATLEATDGAADFAFELAKRIASEPVTPVGLQILLLLLRGETEPWERAEIGRHAAAATKLAPDPGDDEVVRSRLYDALMELGIETEP